jgi:glycosyltransferase involved in cell wall biosynthesis
MPIKLPRLAFVSDVPVQNTYHGSALLYRLLDEYGKNDLLIVESNILSSDPALRVSQVPYQSVAVGNRRLLNTRFHRLYSAALTLRHALLPLGQLDTILDEFRPEAVLSVTHGYLWQQAALYAKRRNLPLHLIHHDDWPSIISDIGVYRRLIDSLFGAAYRQAVSRLCVSPGMAEEYERRYGAVGQVLYPFRSSQSSPLQPLVERNPSSFTVAFAGTINTSGYADLLRTLALHLHAREGRLVIYGPVNAECAAQSGLDLPNIDLKGFVPSNELPARLRSEADVLFAPMSFALSDRINMQMGFPSKLADYTAMGLPILICGPTDCSAVRWARENPGSAECAFSQDDLASSLDRLMSPDHRMSLAHGALAAGLTSFSFLTASDQLSSALTAQSSSVDLGSHADYA